jgi:nucleoid-associated protein YgaU
VRKSTVLIVGAGLVVLVLAIVLLTRGEQTEPTQEAATTSTTQDGGGETSTATPAKTEEEDEPATADSAGKAAETEADDEQAAAPEPSTGQPSTGEPSTAEQTASLPQAADQQAPEEEPAAKPEAPAPSFDVVRVERSGETVIAGRAAPGSEVIVMLDGEEIGRVTADGRGEWVLIPHRPLPPGSHEFSLIARLPDGSELKSEHLVLVYVPEPKAVAAATGAPQDGAGETMETGTTEAPGDAGAAAGESEQQAFAFLVPRGGDGETRVLQGPEIGLAAGALRLDSIYYDEAGYLTLIGRVEGGGRVFAYVDNGFAGEGLSDDADRWQIKPAAPVDFGLHELRIDQVDEQGQVISRVETPFARSALVADLPDSERLLVVQPGDSLWRLARGAYQEGVMYTLLFEANRDQIRDADLIYPGQIFVVPEAN